MLLKMPLTGTSDEHETMLETFNKDVPEISEADGLVKKTIRDDDSDPDFEPTGKTHRRDNGFSSV